MISASSLNEEIFSLEFTKKKLKVNESDSEGEDFDSVDNPVYASLKYDQDNERSKLRINCLDIYAQYLFKKEKVEISKFYQIDKDLKLRKGINILAKNKFKKLIKDDLEDPIEEGSKL